MINKTIEDIRKIFAGDRFATENGAVIEEVGERTATCSLTITDSHRNAMGAVMGGTYVGRLCFCGCSQP